MVLQKNPQNNWTVKNHKTQHNIIKFVQNITKLIQRVSHCQYLPVKNMLFNIGEFEIRFC